jgi:hypothetical protein
MPGARLPKRKLRELLQLHAAGLPGRQIGASVGIGQSTIVDYLARARRASIAWPLPDDTTDEALEAKLFPPPASVPKDQRPLPHWPTVHRELKRAGGTTPREICGRPSRTVLNQEALVATGARIMH